MAPDFSENDHHIRSKWVERPVVLHPATGSLCNNRVPGIYEIRSLKNDLAGN